MLERLPQPVGRFVASRGGCKSVHFPQISCRKHTPVCVWTRWPTGTSQHCAGRGTSPRNSRPGYPSPSLNAPPHPQNLPSQHRYLSGPYEPRVRPPTAATVFSPSDSLPRHRLRGGEGDTGEKVRGGCLCPGLQESGAATGVCAGCSRQTYTGGILRTPVTCGTFKPWDWGPESY